MAVDTPDTTNRLAERLVAKHFGVANSELLVGGVPVGELAKEFGTPFFVYDANVIRDFHRALKAALGEFASIYYSIKANPNPAIVRVCLDEGTGIEIASAGEYRLARQAGAAPERILYAGPGKRSAELELVLREGIGELHVESHEEIATVERIAAELGTIAPVAIRVNPSAAVQGGAMRMGGKPAPFGFDEETLEHVVDRIRTSRHLELRGVHLFAATQILSAEVLRTQWRHGLELAGRVAGQLDQPLQTIDLGGGLGIPYFDGDPSLDLESLLRVAKDLLEIKRRNPLLRDARVIVEPGRFLVGTAGVYVVRVVASKHSRGQRFLITDGGMHHHLAASGNLGQVIKRDYPLLAATRATAPPGSAATVVGPLCTPLDTLARKVVLPDLAAGDLLAVLQSGAYGLTASPQAFLSHPPPAEILVDGGRVRRISL